MKFIVSSKSLQAAVNKHLIESDDLDVVIDFKGDNLKIGNETLFVTGRDEGRVIIARDAIWRLNFTLREVPDQPLTITFDSKIIIQSITL